MFILFLKICIEFLNIFTFCTDKQLFKAYDVGLVMISD